MDHGLFDDVPGEIKVLIMELDFTTRESRARLQNKVFGPGMAAMDPELLRFDPDQIALNFQAGNVVGGITHFGLAALWQSQRIGIENLWPDGLFEMSRKVIASTAQISPIIDPVGWRKQFREMMTAPRIAGIMAGAAYLFRETARKEPDAPAELRFRGAFQLICQSQVGDIDHFLKSLDASYFDPLLRDMLEYAAEGRLIQERVQDLNRYMTNRLLQEVKRSHKAGAEILIGKQLADLVEMIKADHDLDADDKLVAEFIGNLGIVMTTANIGFPGVDALLESVVDQIDTVVKRDGEVT